MTLERVSGPGLLVAAIFGVFLTTKAPQRWGRPGRALLLGGLSVLLARDVTMIASGSMTRLRPIPGLLLLAETATAGSSVALGLEPLIGVTRIVPGGVPDDLGSKLAKLTFSIHALRQSIFLSPSNGLRTRKD